jgi:nitroreductase
MAKTDRTSPYPVNRIFLDRWSPRAMSGELLSETELMTVLDAARWAPSSYNAQPWELGIARKGTPEWDLYFDLLVDFNKSWCDKAGALIIIVSRNNFPWNNQPNSTHSFDTGAAWENMALQASELNLVAHGMAGFDHDKARKVLNISDDYTVDAMVVLGKPGKKKDLSKQLQENEHPSDRKPLKEIIFEGKFNK